MLELTVCYRIILRVCVHSSVQDANYRHNAAVHSSISSEDFPGLIIIHNYNTILVSINIEENHGQAVRSCKCNNYKNIKYELGWLLLLVTSSIVRNM
jgi:hypothetical protein